MIPWPSSRHLFSAATAQQDKELRFLRNQSGHICNVVKRLETELADQRKIMEAILREVRLERDMSSEMPMYVFIEL